MRKSGRVVVLGALVGALGMAPATASSDARGQERVRRYHVHDVGTLGGTVTTLYDFDLVNFTPSPLNRRGELAVTSATSAGFASGGEWARGALRALPNFRDANVGGGGSNANGINDAGVIVGAADDGVINPRNHQPFDHAVWWDGAGIHRLAELDGNASWANFIADDGVIVGYANNAIPDPYTYTGTQTRATVWQGGVVRDLGTLGGTDSAAFAVSDCPGDRGGARRRVVIGTSSLDTAAGAPFGLPATAAFAWSDGVMHDLGNLGGNYTTPSDVNCRGQVTVISFDASNRHFQSFLWSEGGRVSLSAVGGHFVEAVALDDGAHVVGAVSDPSDQHAIAASWGPSGEGRTLGTVGTDTGSIALGINARGVVVGGSGAVDFYSVAAYAHAFVAQSGGALEDLNGLIPAGSPLTLNVAYAVNDRGEIAGLGTTAAGEHHAFVLTPDDSCDEGRFQPASESPAAPNSVVRMESRRGVERGLFFSRPGNGVR